VGHGVEKDGEKECFAAHPGSSQSSLASRMAGANDNHIMGFGTIRHFFRDQVKPLENRQQDHTLTIITRKHLTIHNTGTRPIKSIMPTVSEGYLFT
jgi:hypothetical protein